MDTNDQGNDHKSQEILIEVGESMHSVAAYITAIDKVEDLHEDEAIPAQCEMFHLILAESKIVLINSLSRCRVRKVEDFLACEHHDHHDSNHEERHSENLAVHGRGHDLSCSVVSFSSSGGSCRGESKSTKDVHNQVDVDYDCFS